MKTGPQGENTQKVKPVDSEVKNLHKRVLEEIFKSPLNKRSEVVAIFTSSGHSRQYCYTVLKELESLGLIVSNGKWIELSDKTRNFLKKNEGRFPA